MAQEITLYAGAAAFGDGSHPTTESMVMAIDAIDATIFTPRAVCDMGCGAGLLSIRAAQKFGCMVVAVDIERSAVAATRENALKNEVAVHAVHSDGFAHPQIAAQAPYELILMNILAEPLLGLAHEAVAHLAPDGLLIMSGMLLWQQDHIIEAYQLLGLALAHRIQQGDWVTLIWQKP